MSIRVRITDPSGRATEQLITAPVVRLGRDRACEIAFDPAIYPKVSSEHARMTHSRDGLILEHLSRSNKTLVNGQPVQSHAPVKVGDRIRLGYTGPTIEVLALLEPEVSSAPESPAAENEDFGATLKAGPQHHALMRGSLTTSRLEIGSGGIIGRDKASVQFLLDHPHVSRRHTGLAVKGQQLVLTDLASANGTYVNGRRIREPTALKNGDRVDIGPFSLQLDGVALVSRSRFNNIELAARRIKRIVKDRSTGNPLTLLHDVSLVIRPHEFVCLLGPSGSGKSTLLAILSGRNPPDGGSIEVNGEDLYTNFAAIKEDIAVVPQKDLLHETLAVDAALRFTAELRLPPDTGADELDGSVTDILDVVGLTKRRGTLIRHLSGGQLKRASLANELMARPSLLFIDEVTSGLDEETDREIMELFRQVADSGKTVVCITHNLANVEATCHLVVILTEGGRVAFVGSPDEAKDYFGATRLGDVYRRLSERQAQEWQADFKASPLYDHYVRQRILKEADADTIGGTQSSLDRKRANPLRQAWVLTRRYVAIWAGDPQALAVMLGQSLLVAVLLGTVFGRLASVANGLERTQRTINLLFLLNVSCFWFGCNSAAKELVKERVIFGRERDFNLRIDSYFASKFLVLFLIAMIQVTFLFWIVRWWCGPAGGAAWQWLALVIVAIAGTALGLLISAFARTEEVAVALVPIVVMPQIILAGVIAPLTGLAKWLADGFIAARWAQGCLESLLPASDLESCQLSPGSYRWQMAVIALHAIAYSAAALVALGIYGRKAKTG